MAIAAAILIAFALASLLGLWLGIRNDHRDLEHRMQAVQRALDVRVASADALLTSVAGMYRASDEIRPYELLDLSRELLSAYPFIRMIFVSDAVAPEDRTVWEQQMHEEGFHGLRIAGMPGDLPVRSGGTGRRLFPIKFLEPLEPEFAQLLGFDQPSHPAIRETLDAVIDSGAIETTKLFAFADGVSGWLFLKAVYFGHEHPRTLAERRRQLFGVVALQITLDGIIADISEAARGLAIRIDPDPSTGTLFHSAVQFEWRWPPLPVLSSRQPTVINGRPVSLELTMRPYWNSQRLALPATFGLLTLMLGLAAAIAYRNHRVQDLRAAELARVDRETEKRFRDYLEVASDWFWSMDADLRFDFVSDRIKDVTGLDPADFIGRSRFAVVGDDPEMNRRVAQNIEDMKAQRSFRDFQYCNSEDPGRPRWFSVSGKPVFSDSGEFQGYRGTARDITPEIRAREEITRAREAAERANQVKSEFLATMSHELRTPLNAILGFSEVMKEELMGPVGSQQYREYAENINDSGQHLLDLINDILDISKIGAGKDELDETDIPIAPVMESVRNLVLPRAKKGGVALTETLREPLPDLRADERKLKQVLLNLIVNAVKFTDRGGEVRIDVRTASSGGVAFEISDNGIGIAPEQIKTAFQQFDQVDSTLARKYEGTGLGLPLAKALVELHDGTLELRSTVGIGTTVTVRFPAARSILPSNVVALNRGRAH